MNIGIQFYFIMVTQFVTKIFAFIASVLMARIMGPTVVGIIAFAYSFVGLLEFLFDMGTGTAHIKRISEGRDYSRCLGAYALIKALLGLVALGVVLVAYGVVYRYREGFQGQAQKIVIFIILGSVFLDQAFMYYFNTFKAQLKFGKSQIVKSVKDIADSILVICVVLFWRDIYVLATAHLVSEVIGAFMGFCLLKNRQIKWPDSGLLRSYISFSIPMFAVTMSWTVYQNVDKVMIRSFWPAADVGMYHVAYRICAFALLLAASLNAILFPTISRFHGEGKMDSIKEVLFQGERFTAILVTPFALLFAVFSKPIVLTIWGTEYLATVPILRVLAIFTLVACLEYPIASGILGIGKIWGYFWLFLSNLVLLIGFNIIFIPQRIFGINMLGLGALGAAWGSFFAVCFTYIFSILFLLKFIKVEWFLRICAIPLIGLLVGAGIWILNRFDMSLQESLYLVPAALAGYLILLFLTGSMTRKDVGTIIKILKPDSTRHYLISEFKEDS